MFFVYALYNSLRAKIYIGHTANLEIRVARHNGQLKNKAKSFTSKNSGLWEVVYSESFLLRKEALIRERQLKSAKGREFVWDIIKKQKQSPP